MIERVESVRNNLEIMWDDGVVLHTQSRFRSPWHLYRAGERWRRSTQHVRVVIEVPEWIAVCFRAGSIETYREYDPVRHPGFGPLAPDLCLATDEELQDCVGRIRNYEDPDVTIAEVLLDQHVACGVGNVYRSEVLWACELSPFATVGSLSVEDCTQVINAASRMLRSNLERVYRGVADDVPGGLAVWGRSGTRCARCGDTVRGKRVGDFERMLYFCPGCQIRNQPIDDTLDGPSEREMDPHPAAAMFNADLPWRRHPGVS